MKSQRILALKQRILSTEKKMKQVIINADDLGMSSGINEAIARASKYGMLTSASIMVNMPAYEDALKKVIANNPDLGIGIHLCLTEGKSVLKSSDIPLLVNTDGYFKNSFLKLYIQIKKDRRILQQIESEINAQFEKLCADGIMPDHVNGHHHIHMIPYIFDITLKIAKSYNCKMVRLAHEHFLLPSKDIYPGYYFYPLLSGNIIKKLLLSKFAKCNKIISGQIHTPDYFFGVLHSGRMDLRVLQYILHRVQPGVTEILVHPGLYNRPEASDPRNKKMDKWLQSMGREVELEALLSDSLRHEIERNSIQLVRFGDVAVIPGGA
jgi:hopanoid biosynthesis associated protein HpnK